MTRPIMIDLRNITRSPASRSTGSCIARSHGHPRWGSNRKHKRWPPTTGSSFLEHHSSRAAQGLFSAMSARARINGPNHILVMTTCPRCGTGAKVSSTDIRVDETSSELFAPCTPRSCEHLGAAIATAQQLPAQLVTGPRKQGPLFCECYNVALRTVDVRRDSCAHHFTVKSVPTNPPRWFILGGGWVGLSQRRRAGGRARSGFPQHFAGDPHAALHSRPHDTGKKFVAAHNVDLCPRC
jgi:hypothetical protein